MIRQVFGEESVSRTRILQIFCGRKKARQMKSKVNSMLIIFFAIKGIVRKEFFLAGQTVNSAYYCDVLRWMRENMRRLRPELWWKKKGLAVASRQPTVSNFLSHQRIFYQNNMTVAPQPSNHPTILLSVSPIEDEPERPPFWHKWWWSRQNGRRCWTRSRNTTSRMHSKNGRSSTCGRGLLRW
jgi:hypothetical protein